MVQGKGWKKCCPVTCGTSAGAATQGMISTRSPCTRDASACLQSGRPGDMRCGCSAGLESKTFNAEEGKSSLGESLPSRAFSGCPWRSATATTNASGMARSSRRVGLGTSIGLSSGRLQTSSLDSWTCSFDAKVLNWEMLPAQIPPNQLPQWHAGFIAGVT